MNKHVYLSLLCLPLSGCALVATVGGGSAATIQAAQTIDAAKLGADAVSGATTGKTLTDHAISYVANKDCTLFNIFGDKPICVEYNTKTASTVEVASLQPPPPVPVETINPITLKKTNR